MSDTAILFSILSTLQRLEGRVEGQDGRLKGLELFMSSSTSGSSFHGSSSSAPQSPVTDQDASDGGSSVASPQTPPSESPAGLYEASIMQLRRRFEFVDGSRSDLSWPRANAAAKGGLESQERLPPSLDVTELHGDRIDGTILRASWNQNDMEMADAGDDAYSMSVYSSRPLSRFDLKADIVPPLPLHLHSALPERQSGVSHSRSTTPDAAYGAEKAAVVGPPESLVDFPFQPVTIISRRRQLPTSDYAGSFGASSHQSTAASRHSSKRKIHEVAGTALNSAYSTLKSSLRRGASVRSKSWRIKVVTTKKHGEFIQAEAGTAHGSNASGRSGRGWTTTMRSAIVRIVTPSTYYRPRPYVMA